MERRGRSLSTFVSTDPTPLPVTTDLRNRNHLAVTAHDQDNGAPVNGPPCGFQMAKHPALRRFQRIGKIGNVAYYSGPPNSRGHQFSNYQGVEGMYVFNSLYNSAGNKRFDMSRIKAHKRLKCVFSCGGKKYQDNRVLNISDLIIYTLHTACKLQLQRDRHFAHSL